MLFLLVSKPLSLSFLLALCAVSVLHDLYLACLTQLVMGDFRGEEGMSLLEAFGMIYGIRFEDPDDEDNCNEKKQ